jgi:hypothetical protein
MKSNAHLTAAEIRKAGWKALLNALGPEGSLRFILEYESGEGDYVEQRRGLFDGKCVQDLAEDMRKSGYIP